MDKNVEVKISDDAIKQAELGAQTDLLEKITLLQAETNKLLRTIKGIAMYFLVISLLALVLGGCNLILSVHP